MSNGQDGAGGVDRHGQKRGPALVAVDQMNEQLGRPCLAIGRIDVPHQGVGRVEGNNRPERARGVGQGDLGDRGGEGELPDGGAGLVELERAAAAMHQGAVVAPCQGLDTVGQAPGMAVQSPSAVGRLEVGNPALADPVGDDRRREMPPRGRGHALGGIADKDVDAERPGLEDNGVGGEQEALAAKPAERAHQPGRGIGVGQVAMESPGDESGDSGGVPAPERGGRHALLGGLDAGKHGAVGPDDTKLDALGTRRLGETLPAAGPGPAKAALGQDAVLLVRKGDGPAELGHRPEVGRRIARRGWMGARIVRQEALGRLLGVGPAVAVPVGRVGGQDERYEQERAHASHPAPPGRGRKRRDASGEWGPVAGGGS